MSNPEKADPSNNTLGSFLTSLALNGGLLVLQVVLFILLKSKLSIVYEPRSFIPPEQKRAEPLKPGIWRWIPQTIMTEGKSIIKVNGLDAYMSIRFFEMMMKVFLVFTLVTWPILLPTNAVGMPYTVQDGLARLGIGNINPEQQQRYWAHLIVAWGLAAFVMWMMRKELLLFVSLRQQFLLDRSHSRLAQARTVLITAIPNELADEHKLRELFTFVPGGISKIWIYRNETGLPEAYDERNALCDKLESATTVLLQTAVKARVRIEERQAKAKRQEEKLARKENGQSTGRVRGKQRSFPLGVHANMDDVAYASDMEKIGAQAYLSHLHRPQHRVKEATGMAAWLSLPTWLWGGRKVDTIDYCTEHIDLANKKIIELRAKLPESKPFGACFIQCELQIGAHVLAQCLSYHEPLFMAERWIEAAPEDIVWANIDDGAYEMRTRYALSWLATIALLIIWGFPVAIAGFTSNVSLACSQHWWLAWICRTSQLTQNIIQGVFPPVLLAVLFLILPYFLKGLAWFENIPRWSLISLSVYQRYFMFLVVHGFLIITVFSALSAVIRDIANPEQLVYNLSHYVPNASSFFLTYLLQQGLMGAAGALLQVGPLILYFVKNIFFGNTPREAFQATFLMPSFDFGIMLPRMSLLATVGLAYSIISPVVNALALVAFACFWFSWKFLLIWVLDQPDAHETSGLYFPLLMSNLFVGLYMQEIVLMGIFFFAQDTNGNHTSIAEGVLMALLIFCTAVAQIFFRNTFKPVTDYLPMSLSTRALAKKFKLHEHDGEKPGEHAADPNHAHEENIDFFNRDRLKSVVRHRLRQRGPSYRRGTGQSSQHVDEAERKQEAARRAVEREKAEQAKRKAADEAMAAAADLMAPKEPEPTSDKVSVHSNHSDKSDKSGKKGGTSKLLGALAAAQPGGLKIDEAAKRVDDGDSDMDDDFEEHAFDHPSTYAPQRMIWLPKWEAHPDISQELVKEIQDRGVLASDIGSLIDEGGNVTVSRGPPDEDWSGGHDQ